MTGLSRVFVADSCIGGLSVVKSLWNSGSARDAVFLADYEVNPLGVKSDSAIADVVDRWLTEAHAHSDTLVIACNTLSIRYHQLRRSDVAIGGLTQIVSMVDCFAAMVRIEADWLADKKVLIMGTEFTASQPLYPGILVAALPRARIDTIAATELERRIARFQPWESEEEAVLTNDLRQAISNADVAVLACTCFPMVRSELESLFPETIFLDPGTYCAGLLNTSADAHEKKLSVKVTGNVVSERRVTEFAGSYLSDGRVNSSWNN